MSEGTLMWMVTPERSFQKSLARAITVIWLAAVAGNVFEKRDWLWLVINNQLKLLWL